MPVSAQSGRANVAANLNIEGDQPDLAGLLRDETLRCLVVTGEGPAFSAGIDLVEGMAGMLADMAERPRDSGTLAAGQAAAGTFTWIPDLGCASVAAVRGHARSCGGQEEEHRSGHAD